MGDAVVRTLDFTNEEKERLGYDINRMSTTTDNGYSASSGDIQNGIIPNPNPLMDIMKTLMSPARRLDLLSFSRNENLMEVDVTGSGDHDNDIINQSIMNTNEGNQNKEENENASEKIDSPRTYTKPFRNDHVFEEGGVISPSLTTQGAVKSGKIVRDGIHDQESEENIYLQQEQVNENDESQTSFSDLLFTYLMTETEDSEETKKNFSVTQPTLARKLLGRSGISTTKLKGVKVITKSIPSSAATFHQNVNKSTATINTFHTAGGGIGLNGNSSEQNLDGQENSVSPIPLGDME